jgi:predicted N-acyltransferase
LSLLEFDDTGAGAGRRNSAPALRCRVIDALEQVPADAWNALAGCEQPFLRHEFLAALEITGCVGEETGWYPRHLLFYDGEEMVAAAPMYLKTHSYGEFVFDWAWAEAYARAGLDYYPKLVSAIPFTPVTGPRILVADASNASLRRAIAATSLQLTEQLEASSVHWLFADDRDREALETAGLSLRAGYQFHWQNPGFRDFQDYLDSLRSKKRKQIRRERREAASAGLKIELLHGNELSDDQCDAYHRLYTAIYDRKWGYPSLSREFFHRARRVLGEELIIILAGNHGRYVAGAHLFRGSKRLYGRNWGCSEYHRDLHFEICYYRAIEYCIDNHLDTFEAGAQGEHKLSRGFRPVMTYSAHGVLHPGFQRAIGDFTRRERIEVGRYIGALAAHSPFRA